MPNKLFEYAMAGLPVMVSKLKDMSNLVEQYQMGVVVDDVSISGVNVAIDALLSHNLDSMKIKAYRVACDYSWEVQEIKLLAAYKKIGIHQAMDWRLV